MDWNTIMLSMMEDAQSLLGSSWKKIKVGDKMISVSLRINDLETPDIEIPLEEQKLLPNKDENK